MKKLITALTLLSSVSSLASSFEVVNTKVMLDKVSVNEGLILRTNRILRVQDSDSEKLADAKKTLLENEVITTQEYFDKKIDTLNGLIQTCLKQNLSGSKVCEVKMSDEERSSVEGALVKHYDTDGYTATERLDNKIFKQAKKLGIQAEYDFDTFYIQR